MQETKPTRRRRRYNTRLIKGSYSYTLQEIAELYDIHVNAVRRWLKHGLPTIDHRRPFLVHGGELIDFLEARQSQRKHRCAPNEFYCCRCRKPQRPLLNAVEIKIENQKQVTLSAKCARCGAAMNRIGSIQKLAEYSSTFAIQTIEQRRIRESSEPSVMCQMDEDL